MHFVVIKAFARVGIEFYVEFVVNFPNFFQSDFFKEVKELNAFLVAVFDEFEIASRFVVHDGVFLAFLMITDVKAGEFFNAALFNLFRRSPMLICVNKFAELRSVVSEVVDAHGVVAEVFENAVKRAPDNRCG